MEGKRSVRFFRDHAPVDAPAERTEYWFQRWLAIAQGIGLGKSEIMRQYYFDEFLCMLDQYNDIHSLEEKMEEVYADEF